MKMLHLDIEPERFPFGNDRKKSKCKDKSRSFAVLRMTRVASISGFGDHLDAVFGAKGDFRLEGYGVSFHYFEAPALG
jgi:hypothetical protein